MDSGLKISASSQGGGAAKAILVPRPLGHRGLKRRGGGVSAATVGAGPPTQPHLSRLCATSGPHLSSRGTRRACSVSVNVVLGLVVAWPEENHTCTPELLLLMVFAIRRGMGPVLQFFISSPTLGDYTPRAGAGLLSALSKIWLRPSM